VSGIEVGRLDHIHMTPVKGTALHSLEQATVTEHGIPEDRRFFLIDQRGRLVNGRRHGPLVAVRSGFDRRTRVLTLVLPDGTTVDGRAAPTGEAVSVHFFDHYVAGHVVPGPWQAALSDYCGGPLRLVEADEAGHGLDLEPLTVVGSSSIEWLRGRGADVLDRRRFRASLEISGTPPFAEERWIGSRLRLGEIALDVIGKVPRCRVIRQDPETGMPDLDTLRLLVDTYPDRATTVRGADPALPAGREDHISFAVYGRATRPGNVRVGDPIVLEK
jgi:uncharacterized protein YcbX